MSIVGKIIDVVTIGTITVAYLDNGYTIPIDHRMFSNIEEDVSSLLGMSVVYYPEKLLLEVQHDDIRE